MNTKQIHLEIRECAAHLCPYNRLKSINFKLKNFCFHPFFCEPRFIIATPGQLIPDMCPLDDCQEEGELNLAMYKAIMHKVYRYNELFSYYKTNFSSAVGKDAEILRKEILHDLDNVSETSRARILSRLQTR